MRCPFCSGNNSRVTDTRELEEVVRRRRVCLTCGQRFTTYERPEPLGIMVVKKDGRREPYDRRKLLEGLRKACAKRPITTDNIEGIADEVEGELTKMDKPEVPSRVIGEMVMERLRNLDDVAYVRFASVYRQFKDVDGLMEAIEGLRERKKKESGG